MIILGKEVEFDFQDIENMAKYEEAFEKYMNEIETVKKFKGKDSEGFKKLCETVYNFFDRLIEQGASVQILGEKMNYRKCCKAMEDLITEKQRSDEEVNSILKKYSELRTQ